MKDYMCNNENFLCYKTQLNIGQFDYPAKKRPQKSIFLKI